MVRISGVIANKVDVGNLLFALRLIRKINVTLHPVVGDDVLAVHSLIQGEFSVATTNFQHFGFRREMLIQEREERLLSVLISDDGFPGVEISLLNTGKIIVPAIGMGPGYVQFCH